MRMCAAVLMLADCVIGIRPAQGRSAALDRPTCIQGSGVHACKGRGRLVISRSEVSTPSGSTSSEPRAVARPVTTRWVACGANTVTELRTLGDRSPAADVGTPCSASAVAACTAQTAADGVPRAVAIRLIRQGDGSWQYAGGVCQRSGPAQVTAAMVRQQIARLIPRAAIGMAPQQATLVNIQTVMWVDTSPQRALSPLTILGHRVLVTLRLDQVRWDFGDGQSDSPPIPGKRYDAVNDPCRTVECPDYYGHVYTDTGSMTVAATGNWVASFTVDGGPAATIPATVAGPTATAALQVRQARGELVPAPSGR